MEARCVVATAYPERLQRMFRGQPLASWLEGQLAEAGIAEVRFVSLPQATRLAPGQVVGPGQGLLFMARPLPAASPQALAYLMATAPSRLGPSALSRQKHWAPLLWWSPETLAALQGRGQSFGRLLGSEGVQKVEVWDPGLFQSFETPADLAWLEGMVADRQAYGPHFIKAVRDFAEMPVHIRAHCDAVSQTASRFAQALAAQGHPLDQNLVRAGAALHDLCRLMPRHEEAGADLLQRMGYPDLAWVVAKHMEIDAADVAALNEAALVFYADKVTEETCRVTPYQRYARALDRFPPGTEIGEHIMANLKMAWAVETALRSQLGPSFDQLLSYP